MPRFLTIGFILLLSIAADAQRAYISNPQVDTTLMPPAIWQDGKLIPAPPRQCINEYGENDPSMTCMVYPDSNFIRRSFGYPTTPWRQVLANDHIYEAQGGYVVIYEIGNNGILTKTGQQSAYSFIRYLAHDGNYLYVSTSEGFEIFDGTNYIEPARIGENWLEIRNGPSVFSISGDSLYYYYEANYPTSGSTQLGIMNISDRSNPRVVYGLADSLYYNRSSPPLKYQNYLLVTGVRRSHTTRPVIYYFLNLADPSGHPEIIDSLNSNQIFVYKIYDNRLYIGSDSLKIYEFDSGHHLTLRSMVGAGRIYPRKLVEYTIGQNRYIVFTANRSYIYKAIVNDLSHPVIIDSIKDTDLHGAYFMALDCQNDKAYAISPQPDTAGSPGYGIFVYDWALSNPNRRIQWLKGHSQCERVVLYGNNVAYVQTADYEILPIDLSDINHPVVVEDAYNISTGTDPKISGDILFTRNYSSITDCYSITSFGLADPLHPETLWTHTFSQSHLIVQAEIQDSILIASHFRGWPTDSCHLEIVNMANPTNPEILCDTILGFVARYFYMHYPRLYFIDNDYERLRAISISDPRHPSYLGNYIVGNNQTVQAFANSEYMYVYDQLHTYVYDLSHFGSYSARIMNTGGFMDISDRFMFFCGFSEIEPRRGIYAWDITDNPMSFELSAYTFYSSQAYTYMKARYPYVFLTGGYFGLSIYEYGRTSDIEENDQLPVDASLSLNTYPNPFNGQVKFSISSIEWGDARLEIYDIMGREVWSTSEIEQNGNIVWQAIDQTGKPLPSGIYFARLTQGENQVSKKIVLLK